MIKQRYLADLLATKNNKGLKHQALVCSSHSNSTHHKQAVDSEFFWINQARTFLPQRRPPHLPIWD